MVPVTLVVVGLVMASVSPAEAKRVRLLPGTKPAPAAAQPVAQTPKTAPAAPAGPRGTVVIFSTGGGGAASAQDAAKRREALGQGTWTSGAPAEPAKLITPVNLPNPDARELPVLGRGGGDLRPAKGFQSLN